MIRDGLLTQYVEAGFPGLKHVGGVPEGLLPDSAAVARQPRCFRGGSNFDLQAPIGARNPWILFT